MGDTKIPKVSTLLGTKQSQLSCFTSIQCFYAMPTVAPSVKANLKTHHRNAKSNYFLSTCNLSPKFGGVRGATHSA